MIEPLCATQFSCSLCAAGHILETGGASCTLLSDPAVLNPACQQYSRANTCVVCQDGYFMNPASGFCAPCAAANCKFCDFLKPSVCVVCAAGFFMDPNFTCQKNLVEAADDPTKKTYLSDYYLPF